MSSQSLAGVSVERAVVVSDLHLDARIGPRHLAFRDFVVRLTRQEPRPQLFVLGDLFDYWIGRGAEALEGHRFALEVLREAAERGVRCYFLEGNRDFLVSPALAARFGLEVLPPSRPVRFGSRRVWLTHGDDLVLQDRAHLRFRWLLRSAPVRVLANGLPRDWVERVARALRRRSRASDGTGAREANGSTRDAARHDVMAREVARLARGGIDVVVCGHVHAQGRRVVTIDGRDCELLTLGAWEDSASVLWFEDGEFRFEAFPIPEAAGSGAAGP